MAENHFQNLPWLRTERENDADLMSALTRRVGNDAVDADDRKYQSQNPQGGDQSGSESEKEEAIQGVERGGHRLDIENRHGGFEGMNQTGRFAYHRLGSSSRPDLKGHN